MTDPQYDSTPEFQQRIVASIARSTEFLVAFLPCVKAEYFQQDSHKTIVKVALAFYEHNHRIPDQVELDHFVAELLKEEATNSQYLQQLLPVYRRDIAALYEIPTELLQLAQQYAVDFAKKAAYKLALLDSARTINEPGALENAQRRLTQAALVGIDLNQYGIEYFKDARERHNKRLTQPFEMMRMPFLIPKLDSFVGGVGYRKNGGVPEMCVFLAPTNRGKSKALVHCAKVGVSLGLNVVIFTAEMAAELYAERLDMSIALLTTDELYDTGNADKLDQRIRLYEQQGGRMFIKKYPSRQVTIAQTVTLMHHMDLALGFKPNLVIYDYIDEFAPPRDSGDVRRHQLSAISSSMRAVADEFGAAVITATQANREALSKEIVDIAHISEDLGKANVADLIISLCQTKEEEQKSPPEQRWMVCKARSSPKGQIVRVLDDGARMRFMQHPDEKDFDDKATDIHAH